MVVLSRLIVIALFGLTAIAATAAIPGHRLLPQSQSPAADYGHIDRYIVESACLDDEMTVDVWIPESYSENSAETYPVLYAFDGQNLFDPAESFAGVAWELDRSAWELASATEAPLPIIVGIHNRGAKNLRAADYFPENALDYIADDDRHRTTIFATCPDGFSGNSHADFVALELKPLVDSLYRTNPSRDHNMTIGSSMGALAALYLMCEYPDIFGAAAALSTHWVGSLNLNTDYSMNDDPVCAGAILACLTDNLPTAAGHRLYLDQGTAGWDALYLRYEPTARAIATAKGYNTADNTLATYDADGAGHNEWFWQQRASRPLAFLLSRRTLGLPTLPADTPETITHDLLGRPLPSTQHRRLPRGIYITSRKRLLRLP